MPIRQARIPNLVTPTLAHAFQRTISQERWRTYERAAGFDIDAAHRLYLWNVAVGQSFHFPLQTVEVCLRNVVHLALVDIFGPNWSADQNCRQILQAGRVAEITKAEQRHHSIYATTATTPQIVASLSLGFWVAMLSSSYTSQIWSTHTTHAFPHLGTSDTMRNVRDTGRKIQKLRNRIFHQEPLIGQNLSADYSAIMLMIGWICPEMKAWAKANASVPKVMRERPR